MVDGGYMHMVRRAAWGGAWGQHRGRRRGGSGGGLGRGARGGAAAFAAAASLVPFVSGSSCRIPTAPCCRPPGWRYPSHDSCWQTRPSACWC